MLNKKNFLRWTGVFLPCDFELTNYPVAPVTLYANEESTNCTPLQSIISSIGLDYTSFEVTAILDLITLSPITLAEPPQWNSVTKTLTIYRPISTYSEGYFFLMFSYSDLLGNKAQSQIHVTLSPIFTSWVAYPISSYCILDTFGNNTSYQAWYQLQLINMSTSAPIVPLTLKPNSISSSDYIAPVQNPITCPAPGAGSGLTAPLVISNFSKNSGDPNNYITITNIYLSSTTMGPGSTPFATNIPCNIPPGQTARFNVPATSTGYTYDGGITISYSVTGNMDTAPILRYWKISNSGVVTGFGNGGSGLFDNLVDNSGIISYTSSSFQVPNPQGVVIFPQ